MTRKDFELIARAIRDARPIDRTLPTCIAGNTTLDNMAGFLADELRATNPRFDRARFLAACGVKP